MKFLVCSRLSEHRYKTPEGYLVCVDSILSRTGKQTYSRDELFKDGCNDEVEVERSAEEVFSEKTLASFENKPLTIEHPEEDVTPANHNKYSVGFIRDIKRGKDGSEDVMLGTIVVTDAEAIELIETGKLKELSCGYDCDIEDEDNPQQRNIRGNHVALCEKGRAGIARIVDSIKDEQSSKLGDKVRFRNRVYVIIKVQKGKSDDVARLTLRPLERFDENDKPFEGGGDSYWDIRIERWQLDDSCKDSIKDASFAVCHPSKYLFLSVGGKSWVDESSTMVKKFSTAKQAEDYGKLHCDEFRVARISDSIKDAKFEICYIDNGDVCIAIEAKNEIDARQKFRRRYGMYYIKHIRKVKDGVKDMKVSHDNIREQPVFIMQSDVDKNLFFYIGKTHAMKEGEWTYTQYDMEGMTPDELRKELEANGWHKVAKGPAPFIDKDPYEESTEGLEEAEKNLHDEMICNTETDCKDELQTFRIGFGSGGRYDDEPGLDISVDVKATDVKTAIEKAKRWAKAHNYDDAWSFREVKTKGDRHFQIDACKDASDNAYRKVQTILSKNPQFKGKINKDEFDTGEIMIDFADYRNADKFVVECRRMGLKCREGYFGPDTTILVRDAATKDAKTEYVFNYRDTYHGTRDKMRVDANNLDEAIRKFGDSMALGGFGTANIYVVSVSPNDGYMRAYGKLSEMLKQKWTRDSVKKLDSKKLLSIVKAAKSIKK